MSHGVALYAVVPLTLRLPGMAPSSAAFIRVFAQVPHLKSLAIANCHDIVDTPLLPTRDSGSASYSLTSLDARMCGIMDSSLSELAQCLPNLRYLNIRQCFNVAGGLRLVLPQLETLILQSSRVTLVQPAALPPPTPLTHCLHTASVAQIPPSCISQITGSGCPQLRTLNCRGCLELSGEGICGPQLVSLDLSSTAATGPALRMLGTPNTTRTTLHEGSLMHTLAVPSPLQVLLSVLAPI